MAVPTSSVSFSQLRAEYRYGFQSPTAIPGPIPLNDGGLRTYLFSSGPLPAAAAKPVADTRGAAIATFTVSTNTVSYDVRGALVGLGAVGGGAAWTSASGGRATTYVQVIGSGIIFSTPSVNNFAFDTGNPWPATSSTALVTSSTIFIHGKGGPGGDGGSSGGPTVPAATWTAGVNGTDGGTALRATIPLIGTGGGTIYVRGGGGGGGGGSGKRVGPALTATGGGGGGGGATGDNTTPGGAGGVASTYPGGTLINGQNGAVGGQFGGGTGGQNTPQPAPTRAGIGGNGGSHGVAGQSGSQGSLPGTLGPGVGAGGAAGSSITGFSFVVGIPAATRSGPTVP